MKVIGKVSEIDGRCIHLSKPNAPTCSSVKGMIKYAFYLPIEIFSLIKKEITNETTIEDDYLSLGCEVYFENPQDFKVGDLVELDISVRKL